MQQFVVAFGTDENDEADTFNGTIPQALMMMNGELVEDADQLRNGQLPGDVLADKGNDMPEDQTALSVGLGRHADASRD